MTIPALVLGTLVSQLLFVFTKIFFINSLNIDSWPIMTLFFVVVIIETIAVVRRMGILNYFESIFLTVLWLILGLIIDLVITTSFTDRDVYGHIYFWAIYLAIAFAMFIFHKKVHIEVRRGNV